MVGNPVQAEVLSGGWGGAPGSGGKWQGRFADRKGVHPGSFSVMTKLLDKEESHQIRKEEGDISLGDRCSWLPSFTRGPTGSQMAIEKVKALHPRRSATRMWCGGTISHSARPDSWSFLSLSRYTWASKLFQCNCYKPVLWK